MCEALHTRAKIDDCESDIAHTPDGSLSSAAATHASVTERLSRACNPWEARNRLTGSSRRACSRLPLVEPSLRQSTLARSGAVTRAPLVVSSKHQPVVKPLGRASNLTAVRE